MRRVGLALLVLGVLVCFLGYLESVLASVASPEPQVLTCEALHTNGYGDNAHVEISEFCPTFNYVYEGTENSDRYSTIWIPLMPLNSEYVNRRKPLERQLLHGEPVDDAEIEAVARLADFRVLLKSSSLSSEDVVDTFITTPPESIRGLIINPISTLSGEERDLLSQSFPNTDLSKVLILEMDRSPSGLALVAAYWLGGVVLILVGIGLLTGKIGSGRAATSGQQPAASGAESASAGPAADQPSQAAGTPQRM